MTSGPFYFFKLIYLLTVSEAVFLPLGHSIISVFCSDMDSISIITVLICINVNLPVLV
jgi:hypothetical protein